MKPKIRTDLSMLRYWVFGAHRRLRGFTRDLRNSDAFPPDIFSEVREEADICHERIKRLLTKIDAVYEADKTQRASLRDERLSAAEISQLLTLNRRLREIESFLRTVADDVEPRLESKLADPNDAMYDYEIEVIIRYNLREDDPDYEDDDNTLTERLTSGKRTRCLFEVEGKDFTEPGVPEGLKAEPHCWLFNELYDSDYGNESPRLSFRECLRIGSIDIDVQVWQQYDFDARASTLKYFPYSDAECPSI